MKKDETKCLKNKKGDKIIIQNNKVVTKSSKTS